MRARTRRSTKYRLASVKTMPVRRYRKSHSLRNSSSVSAGWSPTWRGRMRADAIGRDPDREREEGNGAEALRAAGEGRQRVRSADLRQHLDGGCADVGLALVVEEAAQQRGAVIARQ